MSTAAKAAPDWKLARLEPGGGRLQSDGAAEVLHRRMGLGGRLVGQAGCRHIQKDVKLSLLPKVHQAGVEPRP